MVNELKRILKTTNACIADTSMLAMDRLLRGLDFMDSMKLVINNANQ